MNIKKIKELKPVRYIKTEIYDKMVCLYKYLQLCHIESKTKKQIYDKCANYKTKDNKQYLLISGMGMEKLGLFCCVEAFLKWVEYADMIGFIPVIDMENVKSQYLDDDLIGKVNAWEYYYHPVGDNDVTVSDVLMSNSYKVVNRLDRPLWMKKADFQKLVSTEYSKDIYWKYFKLSQEASEYIKDKKKKLFSEDDIVCGVLCRGSDYVNLKPRGHNIQPDINMLKAKIHEVCDQYHCNKIYVATEDEGYLSELKKEFGEKLVYLDCQRVQTSGKELVSEAFKKKSVNKKMNGMDYLTSINLLSSCDCIIAGRTCATPFIRIMREKDEDFMSYFEWDLGKY